MPVNLELSQNAAEGEPINIKMGGAGPLGLAVYTAFKSARQLQFRTVTVPGTALQGPCWRLQSKMQLPNNVNFASYCAQIRWYDLRYVISTNMACADNFFCPLPVRGAAVLLAIAI
jgi:hypothetical protein